MPPRSSGNWIGSKILELGAKCLLKKEFPPPMSDSFPGPSFNLTYSVQPTDIGSGDIAGIELEVRDMLSPDKQDSAL
jgi:hypothetical protein